MQRALERARARRADEGFTLIELLIVIIILGILAAIVVFSVSGITNKGNSAACKSTVSEIDTAAEAAVANGDATSASAVTMSQLTAYFHNGAVPTSVTSKSGTKTTIASGDTVATVDAINCDA